MAKLLVAEGLGFTAGDQTPTAYFDVVYYNRLIFTNISELLNTVHHKPS